MDQTRYPSAIFDPMKKTIRLHTSPRRKVTVTVHTTTPHPQSSAASVLLREYLRANEDDDAKPLWQRRVDFNTRFLRKVQEAAGELVCAFCGKSGLVIDSPYRGSLATADHFQPTSKGGALFDEANLVVACAKCNNKKADRTGIVRPDGSLGY